MPGAPFPEGQVDSLLSIISSQRERFRARNQELEGVRGEGTVAPARWGWLLQWPAGGLLSAQHRQHHCEHENNKFWCQQDQSLPSCLSVLLLLKGRSQSLFGHPARCWGCCPKGRWGGLGQNFTQLKHSSK